MKAGYIDLILGTRKNSHKFHIRNSVNLSNKKKIFFFISKLHTHPMGLEPTTSPSIPYNGRRKCQLSYSSLAKKHTGIIGE
jgi:hypothetical protein